MKKLVIAALAATTALTGVMAGGVAAAQPGHPGYYERDYDRDRSRHRDWDRDHVRRDHYRDGRVRRDWDRMYRHDRWAHGRRYYGGRYGYWGYRGPWRAGQRYPHWRDNRYVIYDWRAYRLPPPRPGYRYYRDDHGDIVMVAIASGIIGLIVGSTLDD